MKKSSEMLLIFVAIPFIVSAAGEFLPSWLSVPIMVIGAFVWVGNLVEINNYTKEKANEN
jgi:hypothetical protein